jgi:aminopeptidase N
MLDAQHAAAAAPAAIRRKDYRPPEWLVPEISLDFELGAEKTIVRATLQVERAETSQGQSLRLNGDGIAPVSVREVGADATDWRMDGADLLIALGGERHTIEIVTELNPRANTKLMGLYESSGMLCTQCEAQGFRRITFFPDRPDVLTRYRVRMTADKKLYPILLSNGNREAGGDLPDGRHWAEWHDPFPKPSYLFALVAGDLAANRDSFVTSSGRTVTLGIWVREADLPRTGHAMASLKAAMKWDEQVYGREYDLDTFNIVAVADFNFGAMENKGLNIFNSRYVLVDPDTATDADHDAVAAVVAHEYFHNWSGDRVTCRDWFQLSLKEGFTVFRDQSFSADMGSPPVKRIEDVRALRAAQFPEDAGPLAHPVRPDSYIEISNFYTATIYSKGAELIRMMHTLLGPEKFRAGTDLYFERHDGQAVTCEDFVRAMEDASGVDLETFRIWYGQAGTPRVSVTTAREGNKARIRLEQMTPPTPGQKVKAPVPIPLKLALFGAESGAKLDDRLVLLDRAAQELVIDDHGERPILSVNRGFSAPIIVQTDRGIEDLAFLSAHDDDPFARYEAMQQVMLDTLLAAIAGKSDDYQPVVDAVRNTLGDEALDHAFIAEAVLVPTEAFIGDQMKIVDPDAIHAARERLRERLGRELEPLWRAAYASTAANRFALSPSAKGARRLRTVALGFLMASGAADAPALALKQYDEADNMTDRQGALGTLANSETPERDTALAAFYERYKGDALVIDKWFTVQALSARDDTLQTVQRLLAHPDFSMVNPNRLRALVGAFGANQRALHDKSGDGYRFLADAIIAVDKLNPQNAAKLVPPLGRWRRFGEERARLMRAALERILATRGLSKDVFEQVSKSLA